MAGLELRMPSVSGSADCTSLMWRGGAELSFQRLAVIILGIPVVIYFMETSGSSIFSTTPMFAGPAGRVTEGFRLSR